MILSMQKKFSYSIPHFSISKEREENLHDLLNKRLINEQVKTKVKLDGNFFIDCTSRTFKQRASLPNLGYEVSIYFRDDLVLMQNPSPTPN
uniref:SHSP domain-containing protein n=1 Tax=Strongyloides papillosus TaxID=174720 RepID=A0A0N5BJV4_STREA